MLYRLYCVVWMGMQHSHTVNVSGLGELALTSKHCIHQRLIVKSSKTLGQGRHTSKGVREEGGEAIELCARLWRVQRGEGERVAK